MLRLISTTFRPHELPQHFFCEDPFIKKCDLVIVDGPNGLMPTKVLTIFQKIPEKLDHSSIKTVLRKATDEDINIINKNKLAAQDAYHFCKKCIYQHCLDMKLIDVELTFDTNKFIFYYTAPTRIDFRNLIKNLIQKYHVRIEMRQVGDRNETQIIGAIGNCGMICCCRRFLKGFTPVSIKMAKEQNIFLTPSKISGQCGKLLCCLSYEQKNYHEFHKKTPHINKQYNTDQGVMKVLRKNMFYNTITVLNNNEEIELSLDAWENLHPICIPSKYEQHTKNKNFSENHHELPIDTKKQLANDQCLSKSLIE